MAKSRVARLGAALLLAVSLVACSHGGGASSAPAATTGVDTNAPLYASLPQKIKDAKEIQLGGDIAYAPMEYYDTDGKTVLGFDKELTDLLSKKVGVPIVWNNATFDGLITQLDSGRFDLVMSWMTDTPERQKQVDFVDYYKAGFVMLVQAGNPQGIKTFDDLCGKTITVQRGTTQADWAANKVKTCNAQGKQTQLLQFDHEPESMLQVQQGRAAAGLQDYPVAVYNTRESKGKFEVVGEQNLANPLGIAVSKKNTQLRDTVQKAVQATIDDGSYKQLIDKYQTPQGAIEKATINGGK